MKITFQNLGQKLCDFLDKNSIEQSQKLASEFIKSILPEIEIIEKDNNDK